MGLVAEAGGKVLALHARSPSGGSSAGGAKIVEVGPIPPVAAPDTCCESTKPAAPPGSITPVHSHPGSEAVSVLAGEGTFRTLHGVKRIGAGMAEAGHGADTPMQATSSGSVDLYALVMFVVDATRPFSSPATLP